MICFKLFGFTINIHYFFWILCLLAALNNNLNFKTQFGWIAFTILILIVTLSVLWHELGHAFYRKKYGAPYSEITLFGMGGACRGPGEFTNRQQIIIAGAGPFFNLMLLAIFYGAKLLIASGALNPSPELAPYLNETIRFGILANTVWAIFMLLPILPLDGGRIFTGLISRKHRKLVPVLSVILSVLIVAIGAITERYPTSIIFGFIAFENWRMIRGKSRFAT